MGCLQLAETMRQLLIDQAISPLDHIRVPIDPISIDAACSISACENCSSIASANSSNSMEPESSSSMRRNMRMASCAVMSTCSMESRSRNCDGPSRSLCPATDNPQYSDGPFGSERHHKVCCEWLPRSARAKSFLSPSCRAFEIGIEKVHFFEKTGCECTRLRV